MDMDEEACVNALVAMNLRKAMKASQATPNDVARSGALLVRKGDVSGHEFHGNQYSDGGGQAQRAKELSDTANKSRTAFDHETAQSAHQFAAKAGKTKEVRAYHIGQAKLHIALRDKAN